MFALTQAFLVLGNFCLIISKMIKTVIAPRATLPKAICSGERSSPEILMKKNDIPHTNVKKIQDGSHVFNGGVVVIENLLCHD
jgi:hypothetical protein